MNKIIALKREKGQVLVIMAVALGVLLVFIGLAIDGTQLFLNYTRLKRAVDAGVVAAANDFKKDGSLARMKESAIEILAMQQVTDTVDVQIYTCDSANIQTLVPDFYNVCPKAGQLKKKLVYLKANENSPTYFLGLIGIHYVPITTNSIAEAAPVDLVIVLDTSESMGINTAGFPADGNFNPASCNSTNTCEPLHTAKEAAKTLINPLYSGYDRVSIVTFDTVAQMRYNLGDPAGAISVLDATTGPNWVPLHDDPPESKLFASWDNGGNYVGRVNLVNPEDRNNDSADDDTTGSPSIPCTVSVPTGDRWDATNHIPCDDPNTLDAFDWNGDGIYTNATCAVDNNSDNCKSQQWVSSHNAADPITGSAYNPPLPMSLVSTCTGCGIRLANTQLTSNGRTNAVWVMVFLTDGVANMSDTPQTFPYDAATKTGVQSAYPNGYCGGHIDLTGTWNPAADPPNYWLNYCQDNTGIRHCINSVASTCPPLSVWEAIGHGGYSVLDYAKDMTDAAALRVSGNANEKPKGNDMAIYTIMFDINTGHPLAAKGAPLLRYMAAVGDDGDRSTDPCSGLTGSPTTSCGQYYFAGDTNALEKVFHDIASRIYTKISE